MWIRSVFYKLLLNCNNLSRSSEATGNSISYEEKLNTFSDQNIVLGIGPSKFHFLHENHKICLLLQINLYQFQAVFKLLLFIYEKNSEVILIL